MIGCIKVALHKRQDKSYYYKNYWNERSRKSKSENKTIKPFWVPNILL